MLVKKINILTKFHEDCTKIVTSRVLTRRNLLTKCHSNWAINVTFRIGTIFQLIQQDIITTNVFTMFHEDWTTMKSAPPPGGDVFQQTGTILELIQDIIETNILTKFHEDLTINCDRQTDSQTHKAQTIRDKNAPPPGGYVFQSTETIFKLVQDKIDRIFLTKFQRTIKLASRVSPRQMLTPHNGQKAITKAHHDEQIVPR
ncbi:hypothetical protein DPMN_083428 [Dreissena polymorpha]|uniref:Uncharacterized protein n=1 Tax=Dreissena polymorpha TaxID=45954 RepID=A0A9D3YCF1_DREPO|nr:hypothetical protein DPMN_083428 [Dreissena polymorpha]